MRFFSLHQLMNAYYEQHEEMVDINYYGNHHQFFATDDQTGLYVNDPNNNPIICENMKCMEVEYLQQKGMLPNMLDESWLNSLYMAVGEMCYKLSSITAEETLEQKMIRVLESYSIDWDMSQLDDCNQLTKAVMIPSNFCKNKKLVKLYYKDFYTTLQALNYDEFFNLSNERLTLYSWYSIPYLIKQYQELEKTNGQKIYFITSKLEQYASEFRSQALTNYYSLCHDHYRQACLTQLSKNVVEIRFDRFDAISEQQLDLDQIPKYNIRLSAAQPLNWTTEHQND